MNRRLLRNLSLLAILPILGGCEVREDPHLPSPEEFLPVLLSSTEDYGQAYLDSLLFFGESTTYHMKDRGVLSGGQNTHQILAPDSGTVNLDHSTPSLLVRYTETGEYLSLKEAVERKQPEYMVLCFGLNGAIQKNRRGEEYFHSCYRALIDVIRQASPDTRIILQSAPPIARTMDMRRYSCSAEELNRILDTINGWTRELCRQDNLRYLNTAEVLKDPDGFLRSDYDVGDGHHLTRSAYEAILAYIRTHGYQ